MQGIDVTVASDGEARACLALLPEAVDRPVELLVARHDGDLAGAAALFWENRTTPAGFPLAIHVVPGRRRQGVGRRLVQAAADLAADETDGLWSWTAVADGSGAARFMAACGFVPSRRRRHFEAAIGALLADVSPKAARLRARGRVPGDLQIVPLSQAPLEEIGRIIATGLGQGPDSTGQGLSRRLGRADDHSQALLLGGRAIGVVLWRMEEAGLCAIDARVVHPRYRGGWPNLFLLEAGLRRGKALGGERFRFDCDDTARDTLSLAERSAAVETSTLTTWCYPIASQAVA